MTKVKPILFNTEMVQALLSGRKTMTRRVVKGVKGNNHISKKATKENPGATTHVLDAPKFDLCPYGKVGDLLYVRETHQYVSNEKIDKDGFQCLPKLIHGFKADYNGNEKDIKWRPSIFMPRYFSRITLEITDIKVERLQDISEEDARAEGIEVLTNEPTYKNYINNKAPCGTARGSFKSLWCSINGRENMDSNPWCWCISFKVHKINVDEFLKNVS